MERAGAPTVCASATAADCETVARPLSLAQACTTLTVRSVRAGC